jgi:hypothetical protein
LLVENNHYCHVGGCPAFDFNSLVANDSLHTWFEELEKLPIGYGHHL